MGQAVALSSVKLYRAALREMLDDQGADLFVTANYNKPGLSIEQARDKLKHLHAVVCRAILGKRWLKTPERVFFVAIPEVGKNGYLHHHILLSCADRTRFQQVAPPLFVRKIAPGGSLDIQSLQEGGRATGYVTKAHLIEHFVISTEFVGK
jgi:hypothetical protein